MTSIRNILIIVILGLALSGLFNFFSSPLDGFDPVQYDILGYNIISGNGFSLDKDAPFRPTMFREPGYPFLLAGMYGIFGHNVRIVILAQAILHALTAVLVYLIGREIFSDTIGFISGICISLFPTLGNMSSYIMSETLFTFLLCLGIYVFLSAVRSKNTLYFIISGIVFGLLILTKTAALFLPLILITALFIMNFKMKTKFIRILFYSACFLLACFTVVSGWSIRNKCVFDTYSLAMRGGDVMYSRAEKCDDSGEEIKATALSSFSEYLGKKMFPDTIGDKNYLYKDLETVKKLKKEYTAKGMEPHKIDALLKKEAFEKIRNHPFKYLAYTPVEAIKMSAFTYLPFLNEERVVGYFEGINNGDFLLSSLRGVFRIMAIPVLALFVIGMMRHLKYWRSWIMLLSVILYFNLIYSLMDTIGRYAVPLIPFYIIFCVSAFFHISGEEG